VSYNEKHNEANRENNQDGTSNNYSWNCGVEGPTEDVEVNRLRERQKRNMLATLFLAQGTPMLLAGDEFGRTQAGNNNAYCQDNEISWLNWEKIDDKGQALTSFVRTLIKLKNTFSILRRGRFLKSDLNEALQVKEITWINATGLEMQPKDWTDGNMRCFGMLLDGRAQITGIKQAASDPTLLLIMNAYHEVVKFKIPEVAGGSRWRCLIDTNDPQREELPLFRTSDTYDMAGRSLLIFALDDNGETTRIVSQMALELARSKQLAR
jgi:glycogen operon protein